MRYIKSFLLLAGLTALFSFIKPTNTFQEWRFIGDKIANFGVDRDVLMVTGNDAFRQIKIRVTSAPLRIIDMDVYFENGDKMNVPLKNTFRQGGESRVIDLDGGVRQIKKITFLYETIGKRKGKARVAVWGKK
ncbi:MAG: hypothetical protein R2765_10575 [Ferruginibacter sp.]|nr:hypothetical protein [Bacteroidota bacterium]MBX2919313.1 hypothetical protein [Ferruginibacter sp.]MCC7380025.1 hypothetical protein [Chitinophagaceae bacterium]